MSNELYHWKYIKREKVGGKWVYTYDKPAGSNVKKDTTTVTDTNKLLSSKTTVTTSSGTHTTHNRGRIERAVDTGKSKIQSYVDGAKRDWKESSDRATKKAVEKAKSQGAKLEDTDEKTSHMRTITTSGSIAGIGYKSTDKTYLRGTREKYVDTAKEYVKDRLGFDEKAAYDKVSSVTDKSAILKTVADKKVQETKEAYYNTPIGKVAEAKERINSAKNYVNELFGVERNTTNTQETENEAEEMRKKRKK